MNDADEARLVEIETMLAFQEQAIDDMSEVIRNQQAEIDELKEKLDLIVKKLRQAEPTAASTD